jgi:hypothetical protein
MFLYLDVSRVRHLSKQYSVEKLEYVRMGLGRKGISRVILILISFLRYPLLHLLLPPLHLGFPHRVVRQMTSSLMRDRQMMGQIVCFRISSADSVNLSISDDPLCIIGSYRLRSIAALRASEEARRIDSRKQSRDLTRLTAESNLQTRLQNPRPASPTIRRRTRISRDR